ncbi:MAG: serine O-acetyltransferase [Salibacteraceae bacterium]
MISSSEFFAHLDRLTLSTPYPTNLSELPNEMHDHILESFQEDYGRYYFGQGPISLKKVTDFPGLLATLLYRVSRYLYLRNREDRALITSNAARYLTHMELYYSADIGPGLKINHGLGLVVGARVKLGRQALLHHNVTLGEKNGGRPEIGNEVTIYPGAIIIGKVHIGDKSTVGANSLVMHTFPQKALLVGSPAQNLRA